jgi:hypothetical protein
MRTIYRLDGKMVNPGQLVEVNGIFYNPLLPGDRKLAGIEEAQVDDFPDLRLFDCTEDVAGNLTITPKDPAVIAAQELAEARRLIQVQIETLEIEITPRRIREAMLTESGKQWLYAKDLEISVLREQLK